MNDKQIIKAALRRTGESQVSLSKKLGYQNKGSIATMLSRPTELRMGVLFKMLDVLGFEIVIRPKNRADKTEWILRDEDEPIETVAFVSDERKEMIAAKELETEQEMEQLKRMIRK